MGTSTSVELSPIVVERVARRVSVRHRRAGMVMQIMAGLTLLLPLGALVLGSSIIATLWPTGLLAAMCLYMYWRRRSTWLAADRIADAASTRRDLDWTHHRGLIQAHDRNGPRPTLLLQASPRAGDVDAALPAARVVERS